MQKTPVRTTVLLTSYNHDRFLAESIDSILNQTYRDFILRIVDDGSTDSSQKIIASYTDPRIEARLLAENTGGGYYNDVILGVQTEYFALAHCDDKWMPDKLEKQVAYLDAHPECAACFTLVNVIDEDGRPITDSNHIYYGIFDQQNRSRTQWLRYFFDKGNCLCHPSVLIRASAYKKYGLLTQGLSGIPDFVQWIRLCHHEEIWIYPEYLSCFRVRKNEENTSGDAADKHYRNIIEQFLTVGEYVDLSSPEEILEVFPECRQYVVDGKIVPAFAYARFLLDSDASPVRHLYAFQLIYRLLQNENDRKELQDLYGYTEKEFSREKQREDIFSLIPPQSFLSTCLYWDAGSGFAEEHMVQKTVYIPHTQRFDVSFDFAQPIKVQSLRFDPDSRFWRCLRDVRITVNGREQDCLAVGAVRQGEEDFFPTLDSQYLVRLEAETELKDVSVTGKVRTVSDAEIDLWFAQHDREQAEKAAALQLKCEELEMHKQHMRAEYERAQNQLAQRLAQTEEECAQIKKHESQLETALGDLSAAMHEHPFKTAARILLRRM